ncbi:MAG: dihydroorotase [Flavobacteriaceae bacterium]
MNILLKSATIIDGSNKELHLKKRDIFIKNGIIDKIAQKLEPSQNARVVDLKNLHVSIGWFDSGVCFGEPGYEERETIANGLYTAGKSGFTDIVLNPNSHPVPDSSSDIIFLINASKSQATNLHPLGTLTVKAAGESLAELFDMKNAGAVGFYDFERPLQNPNLFKIALQYSQNFEGLIYSFPMDLQIAGKGIVNEGPTATMLGLKGIPSLAEELQISRDLDILQYSGGSLHIPTISTAASVKLIAEAKKKGLDVSCSVSVHHLWFTEKELEGFDTHFKVLPPLRNISDVKALIKGLKDGVVDFVTTNHTPMDIEQKRIEFDNAAYGTIGLESAFGILNQIFGAEMAVTLLTRGRERYGLVSPKIKEGEPACLSLFETESEYVQEKENLISTSKNSAFLGNTMRGTVYGTVCNNMLII